MLKVSKKSILVITIYVFLLINNNLVPQLFKEASYMWMLRFFAIESMISLGLYFFSVWIKGKYFYSLSSLFVVFSYLFHMGQVFLNAFFPHYRYSTANFLRINQDSNLETISFCLNIILIVSVFIIFSEEDPNERLKHRKKFETTLIQKKMIAWIILLISFPLEVSYYNTILDATAAGLSYEKIYNLDFAGWFVQIASFTVLGFALLICAYSDDKKIATVLFFAGCSFYVYVMTSGSRIYAVVSICIMIYCYIHFVRKVTLGRLLVYCVFGIIFMTYLHSIMRLRQSGIMTIQGIIKYASTANNNVLLGFLDEFGGTIYTVIVARKEIPSIISFNCGRSYVYSLLTIGLNWGGILNKVNNNIEFTRLFSTRYAFGGSYIGELYYNFGVLSYAVAPLVGFCVGKVSYAMDYHARNKEFVEFGMCVMSMYSIIVWVRSYCNIFARNIGWSCLLIYVLYLFSKKVLVKIGNW